MLKQKYFYLKKLTYELINDAIHGKWSNVIFFCHSILYTEIAIYSIQNLVQLLEMTFCRDNFTASVITKHFPVKYRLTWSSNLLGSRCPTGVLHFRQIAVTICNIILCKIKYIINSDGDKVLNLSAKLNKGILIFWFLCIIEKKFQHS